MVLYGDEYQCCIPFGIDDQDPEARALPGTEYEATREYNIARSAMHGLHSKRKLTGYDPSKMRLWRARKNLLMDLAKKNGWDI